MIYYQNGIQNSLKDAEKGAQLLKEITGQKVGIINNKTAGEDAVGLTGDLIEYAYNGLELKDVLNAKAYEDIAKNGDNNNLIILHSAGNEDAYKALQVLVLENRSLDNKIDFISVASPRSKNDLKKATSKVNSNLFNQYNNYKDPVTWGPAGMTAGLVAPAVGVFFATPIVVPALGVYAIPAAGIAGAAEMGGIYFNHGIDQYLNKDYNGIKTDIKLWAEQNSSTKSTK